MEYDDPNIDPETKALGRRLRLIFFEEKSRALKRPYKPSNRHDQIQFYYKAATQVKRLEADPHDYIQAAIQYCKVKGGPFANTLAGPAAEAWYRMYLEGKGIDATKLGKAKPAPGSAPEPPIHDVVYACDADLQMDVEIGVAMLRLNTGKEDPTTYENILILRDHLYRFPTAARCLLGYHDEQTMRTFGREFYEFFSTQPNYTAAAERAKYPIHDILQWLRNYLQT